MVEPTSPFFRRELAENQAELVETTAPVREGVENWQEFNISDGNFCVGCRFVWSCFGGDLWGR